MSSGARVILEVQWGRCASQRAVIAPGGALRVGRTEPSDFRVPHDRQMSGAHFELSWDGSRCRLRDLASDKGTWLDGREASEGDVKNASWIRAGDTIFMVFFEGATARPAPVDSPEVAARKESALAALRSAPEPLFALLDAARSLRVRELLRESVEEYRLLYEGVKGEALGDVAPYLVSLPKESALLCRLVREGWGEGWGVYLTSARPLNDVRRHLRRILLVELQREGRRPERAYFRFYDPRVLRVVLPTLNARQAAEIFGAIGCFSMEGERGCVERFDATTIPVSRAAPASRGARDED